MARSALHAVCSRKALSDAWEYIRKNSTPRSRDTVGVDGVSISSFERDKHAQLVLMSRELGSGIYCFHSLKPYFIPKANKGYRLISVPAVRDRIVQRALVDFLSGKYHEKLANEISYGFVKSRTVKDAALRACKLRDVNPWVFKTDITSFFDRVDRSLLAQRIRDVVRESSLHDLLISAINCEVDDSVRSANTRIKKMGIHKGRGVRQGMPLSPLFSNFLLLEFDREVLSKRVPAVRYADDLIFFSRSRAGCLDIFNHCRDELGKMSLSIPDISENSKSVIYAPHEPVEFLGLELTAVSAGQPVVLRLSNAQMETIRDELLKLASIPELVSRKITLKNFGQQLSAKQEGYLGAYEACSNHSDLQALLSKLEDEVLRRVYKNGLGIDLTKLTAAARAFLGLR
ncbi:reverse transcriptase domain-containing protein [Castellaniella ginsengisoli]|uniref:Reverse transcriptase domain-containing protein n=1 Tax=Castellaniella ginsengisoli TaxID=546114 RepID=A0AB39CSU3_9BURK